MSKFPVIGNEGADGAAGEGSGRLVTGRADLGMYVGPTCGLPSGRNPGRAAGTAPTQGKRSRGPPQHASRPGKTLRSRSPTPHLWLILVGRWFAQPTNRKLRWSVHRSVTELGIDIRQWINGRTKDPRLSVRAKTTDEILKSLAAYCERIKDH